MQLRISDLHTYPVWVGHRNQLLGKIETHDGIYGWGEAGLPGRELAVASALQHYRWLPHIEHHGHLASLEPLAQPHDHPPTSGR